MLRPTVLLIGAHLDEAEDLLRKYGIPFRTEERAHGPTLRIGHKHTFTGLEEIADEPSVKRAYDELVMLAEGLRGHPYMDPGEL